MSISLLLQRTLIHIYISRIIRRFSFFFKELLAIDSLRQIRSPWGKLLGICKECRLPKVARDWGVGYLDSRMLFRTDAHAPLLIYDMDDEYEYFYQYRARASASIASCSYRMNTKDLTTTPSPSPSD